MLSHGNIPNGLVVCHTCDVRNCVRPDHLWLGTQMENVQDSIKKGRHAKGGQFSFAVATPDMVRAIRARYAEGQTIVTHLAHEFGVGRMVVRGIINGVTWRHVD